MGSVFASVGVPFGSTRRQETPEGPEMEAEASPGYVETPKFTRPRRKLTGRQRKLTGPRPLWHPICAPRSPTELPKAHKMDLNALPNEPQTHQIDPKSTGQLEHFQCSGQVFGNSIHFGNCTIDCTLFNRHLQLLNTPPCHCDPDPVHLIMPVI